MKIQILSPTANLLDQSWKVKHKEVSFLTASPVNPLQRSTSLHPAVGIRWPHGPHPEVPRLVVTPRLRLRYLQLREPFQHRGRAGVELDSLEGPVSSEEWDTGKGNSAWTRGHRQTFPGWETWACLTAEGGSCWTGSLKIDSYLGLQPHDGRRTGAPQWERRGELRVTPMVSPVLLKWLLSCSC